MEFLKALKLAKEQGVSVQEFMPIWQAELQLKQQKEEIKLQELKLKQTKVHFPFLYFSVRTIGNYNLNFLLYIFFLNS